MLPVYEPLFKIMAKYGWSDIHYNNPFLPEDTPDIDLQNRWEVGIRTGPNNDFICVKHCKDENDVNTYKSPRGNSLHEAITKAVIHYEATVLHLDKSRCRKNVNKD